MRALYNYWRSSTAYRVRIALGLKGLDWQSRSVSLSRREHRAQPYLDVNPQGLVPALSEDGFVLAQSMAIIEYLEDTHPQPPLLPAEPRARAYVRMLSNIVACDVHPLNNVRVLRELEIRFGADETARNAWYAHWIAEGMRAFEATLEAYPYVGTFCCGDAAGLADLCLVPQIYNARRYACPLDAYPRSMRIAATCESLPAFIAAHPSRQTDAPLRPEAH